MVFEGGFVRLKKAIYIDHLSPVTSFFGGLLPFLKIAAVSTEMTKNFSGRGTTKVNG